MRFSHIILAKAMIDWLVGWLVCYSCMHWLSLVTKQTRQKRKERQVEPIVFDSHLNDKTYASQAYAIRAESRRTYSTSRNPVVASPLQLHPHPSRITLEQRPFTRRCSVHSAVEGGMRTASVPRKESVLIAPRDSGVAITTVWIGLDRETDDS